MGTLDGRTAEITERHRAVADAAREREWKLPSFGKALFLGSFRLDLAFLEQGIRDPARDAPAAGTG